MKFKKAMALGMAAVMTMSLAACGSSETAETKTEAKTEDDDGEVEDPDFEELMGMLKKDRQPDSSSNSGNNGMMGGYGMPDFGRRF